MVERRNQDHGSLGFRPRGRRAFISSGSAVLFLLSALCGSPTYGFTRLEGEYQLMLDARRTDRSFRWDYDFNNDDTWTGAQFRLFSVPFTNTEAFVKFEADWNSGANNFDRPVFQYRESHLRYRWDKTTYGADAYLFQRQDRFWIENHLIDVVRGDQIKDSDNAQGVRVDLWGLGDSKLTYILSDYSGQSNPGAGAEAGQPVGTDDAHVLRVRREFLQERLRMGATYNRRVEAQDSDSPAFQEVWAVDFRGSLPAFGISFPFGISVPALDVLIEYADARSSNTPAHEEGSWDIEHFSLRRPDWWLPTDANLRGELRNFRIGNPSTGFYNIKPTFWYFGSGYVNPLGEGTKDEQGYWIYTWYLVPQRAITLSLNYLATERRRFDIRAETEFYAEIYTEYVNGFTSKFTYRDRKDKNQNDPRFEDVTEQRDFFAEVQVESRLAWMRVQTKLKDLGTSRRKEIASLESSINLTDKLKVYGRYAFGNDPARLRKGLFTQLQYRPRGNMELFLEFGPGWIGDTPNPVDDGDLEGSGDQKELIKFIIKGTF